MPEISFRPLEEPDLSVLHRWLNEPGVVEWWEGNDVSLDAVARHYWADVDPGIEHWIAIDNGTPFGWIQCYPVTADPEECGPWRAFGVPDTAAGIDYLIGEPGARGQGRGSTMIDHFVSDVVFGRHPTWSHACAGPFSANERSWRALTKAGFTHIGKIDDPGGPCHLMMRDRGGHQDDGR